MRHWTLDDIPWDRFDPRLVDPDLLRIVKAASLVEQNAGDYAHYLCNVFPDDSCFQDAARQWAAEERQHGQALGRWASLADPEFDHAAACARFSAVFRVPTEATRSVRGSRSGELVARCIVETGTSSYYAALGEAAAEPVVKIICRHIAADEIRHYKLFYTHLERYLAAERLGVWGRLRVALGRIAESEDDELAFAYHAANDPEARYDRQRFVRAYSTRTYGHYRRHHVEHAVSLIFKAVGLRRNGWLHRAATPMAWWFMQRRVAQFQRTEA